MANPTRAEILAQYALPTFRVQIYNGSTWDVYTMADILESPSGQIESNNSANGIAFGEAVNVNATVKFPDTVSITANWKFARIKIEMTYNGADWVSVFYGFITGKSREGRVVTLNCGGIDVKINQTKIFSEMAYRRPIASKTSAVIDDDPDDPLWTGGAINEIFWRSGGRPEGQESTYPNADFYYSCDQSLIQPEWTWFSGENLLDELYMLARAAGGQIYQGTDNVIRYVQPLSFADNSSSVVIDDSYFATLNESEQTADQVGTIIAVYTPRYAQGVQIVYEDTTAKLVKPGETITIEARPNLPIYLYASQTASGIFKAVDWNADTIVPVLTSGYSYSAQKVILPVNNPTTHPIVINKVELYGRPVAAGEKQYTEYGSGQPERELEDNPYVQSKFHADQLCRMVYDFYAPIKPVITLDNCGYDPDRTVGETIGISSAYYSVSGEYRVIGISYDLSTTSMTLRCVDVSDLISRNDIFIVGTSYSSGNVRMVSY